jgi:hypothetical protein
VNASGAIQIDRSKKLIWTSLMLRQVSIGPTIAGRYCRMLDFLRRR